MVLSKRRLWEGRVFVAVLHFGSVLIKREKAATEA
jgi:hypothetical protein